MSEEKEQYLRDQDGNIMKDAAGNPMPLSHFENDTTGEHWEKIKDQPDWIFLKKELDRGAEVPEDLLKKNGFNKVNGKWQSPE